MIYNYFKSHYQELQNTIPPEKVVLQAFDSVNLLQPYFEDSEGKPFRYMTVYNNELQAPRIVKFSSDREMVAELPRVVEELCERNRKIRSEYTVLLHRVKKAENLLTELLVSQSTRENRQLNEIQKYIERYEYLNK